jgi:hypothetical protein
MFMATAKMDWDKVRGVAMDFEPVIQQKWPHYHEEMKGESNPRKGLNQSNITHQVLPKVQTYLSLISLLAMCAQRLHSVSSATDARPSPGGLLMQVI